GVTFTSNFFGHWVTSVVLLTRISKSSDRLFLITQLSSITGSCLRWYDDSFCVATSNPTR
uniref:Uncharacterized protein n=1 Tax=Amphimedon queenslandica TaxID=400682 RepID=A0A1X7TMF0_AMPQE